MFKQHNIAKRLPIGFGATLAPDRGSAAVDAIGTKGLSSGARKPAHATREKPKTAELRANHSVISWGPVKSITRSADIESLKTIGDPLVREGRTTASFGSMPMP